MFKVINDIIETVNDTAKTTSDIISGIAIGKMPSKKDISILLDAGLSIYTISDLTGISVDILKEILDSE